MLSSILGAGGAKIEVKRCETSGRLELFAQ
jgi:hypothetical protein